jgi:hypothetical protein
LLLSCLPLLKGHRKTLKKRPPKWLASPSCNVTHPPPPPTHTQKKEKRRRSHLPSVAFCHTAMFHLSCYVMFHALGQQIWSERLLAFSKSTTHLMYLFLRNLLLCFSESWHIYEHSHILLPQRLQMGCADCCQASFRGSALQQQ